jgi:N-acetylmuramoyl-L-alanine amidase
MATFPCRAGATNRATSSVVSSVEVPRAAAFVAVRALILHLSSSMLASRNSLWRTLCAIVLFALAFAPSTRAATEWQVIKVGRWDYLSVDNIAKFYGFTDDLTPVNKTIRLDNGRNQLEVLLDSREAMVNGVRNWLCFPVIQHSDGRYLVSRIDLAKTIEPQFRPHMIRNFGKLKTVVIDPGHGGVEKGAASSYGNEKDFTLDVALKLRTLLQAKGLNVIMTRDKDELVPLHERARIANATKDSIFVSIHFNATDFNSAATGFEIYSLTPRGAPSTQDNSLLQHFLNMQAGSPVDAPSLVLSTSVYHSLLGHMPEFDRGVKRARFAVLRLTNIPAILVEGGFLTEREESRLIAKSEWRGKLAEAISVGIDNYRGLVERKQRPMLLADYRRQFEGELVARNATAPGEQAPPIVPASNRLVPTPSAQLTTALHEEPSEQISLNDTPVTAVASAGTSAPPMVNGDASPAQASSPDASASIASEEPSPSPDNNVGMPDTDESAPPAPPEPADTIQFEATPGASPSPAAKVRKYWILRFDPPPKFRE